MNNIYFESQFTPINPVIIQCFGYTSLLHAQKFCVLNLDVSFLFNIIIICFSEPKNYVIILRLHNVEKIKIFIKIFL